MTKTIRFRRLLQSQELEFLIEAHNGLSAKIGEEAGFSGLWASGLCLAAQYGVRDSNEASWTQVLEMLEFMSDATSVPILLDGDTGYGNFNNLRRLVAKLEQRGVAAVCIEDKLFPKKNSFINGGAQPLEEIDEFCGKIKAGKDAQRDDDFSIVARVEALVAGWGQGEALTRAAAYAEAGADAILIHSAQSTAAEVLLFKQEWGDRAPVVIVPTKYYATPTETFRAAGFSVVIWANHMLRAAVTSMQSAAATLMREQNLMSIEDRVASVGEVFRLQGAAELQEAEDRYLPQVGRSARAVVLAASRGDELGELTESRPKALIEVRGKPLLQHIVDAYNAVGVKDISVVRGYSKEAFDLDGVSYVDNDEHASTGELYSLACALAEPDAGTGRASGEEVLLVSYGDVLFHKYIPQVLLEADGDLVVVVDTRWEESANLERHADYVECSAPDSRRGFYTTVQLVRVASQLPEEQLHGEWTGFFKISAAARERVRALVDKLLCAPENRTAQIPVLLNALLEAGEEVRVVYIAGHWLDVDTLADVVHAGSF